MRNDTSDCRAAGLVARAIPTGMLTRPKLMDPFQIVLMGRRPIVEGCREFAERGAIPPPRRRLRCRLEAAAAWPAQPSIRPRGAARLKPKRATRLKFPL